MIKLSLNFFLLLKDTTFYAHKEIYGICRYVQQSSLNRKNVGTTFFFFFKWLLDVTNEIEVERKKNKNPFFGSANNWKDGKILEMHDNEKEIG